MKIALMPMILLNKVHTKNEIRSNCKIDGGVCFSDQGYIILEL